MHICIIGAGVIGTTSAYYLAQSGFRITLVDAAHQAANGASFANGGQLSYSYVAPLASPGVMRDALRWLIRPGSPLRFRPRLELAQWRWLKNFLHACSAGQSRQTTLELLELARLSRDALHTLMQKHQLSFHHQNNGKLIIHRQPKAFRAARENVAYQTALGSVQQVLDAGECIALEPELKGSSQSLLGGIYTPGEEVGDCHAFTQSLLGTMQKTPDFSLHLNRTVQALRAENGRIVAVRTAQGDIEADHFVVAAGINSPTLLKALGITLPLYPLKGYSLSIPLHTAGIHINTSITDYAKRIVYARLGPTLRIAGQVEIGTDRTSLSPKTIQRLKQQAMATFPHLQWDHTQAWTGLRSATASSKPIIDRAPGLQNLWINTGQGALGFTLACGSGVTLARQITGLAPPVDTHAFSYARVR